MTDRFDPGRLGDWIVFCDICGQKCYASETVKLSAYTGRGGMVVCKYDADKIDFSLVPYRLPVEKPVPYVRINHATYTDNAPLIDPETMGYVFYLAASQDNAVLTAGNALITISESV